MNAIASVLPYIQVILGILMVTAILIQKNGAAIGGAFGGSDNFSSGFHTRRGFEKTIFIATIVLAILFVLSAIIALIV